jgi:inner membrane protein
VDNLTHSLVGMALAELVQPAAATARQRRVLMTAGIVSANLPDIDLAYTWITPPPLGYLLHHRGYTHTVAGLAVLGLLLPLLFRLWPAARELTGRTTLHGLIAINLVGHVSLDALNSYGVHPLYPFDASWYYGDAIFIFEPLVWLVAGIAAVCNGVSRRTRSSIAALLAVLILGMAGAGVVPAVALGSMAVIGSVFLSAVWHARPRMRAGAALGVTAIFMAGHVRPVALRQGAGQGRDDGCRRHRRHRCHARPRDACVLVGNCDRAGPQSRTAPHEPRDVVAGALVVSRRQVRLTSSCATAGIGASGAGREHRVVG